MKKLKYLLFVSLMSMASPPLDGPGDFDFTFIAELPDLLIESSGLEVEGPEKYWSHNDSGNNTDLYAVDPTGDIIQRITLTNVDNTDWEDLAQDNEGNFYIADIGNNSNNRQKLYIHKIPPPADIPMDDDEDHLFVEAETIEFSYEDQEDFPPDDESDYHFDAEGIIVFSDYIYIFTKSHSDPFTGKTRMYRLENEMGTVQEAEYLDQFYTDQDLNEGKITSADISPDGKKVVLCSYQKIWVFYNFEGREFFDGDVLELDIPNGYNKREAICFIDNCKGVMTNERTSSSPESLYSFNICDCIDTEVELSVMLEGPYNASTGMMNNHLAQNGLIPEDQPYDVAPYFYDGNESLDDDEIPEDMVDWILVEVRSGEANPSDPNTELVDSKAGLLLQDGRIVGMDGETALTFKGLEYDEAYHFLIRHRNHLDIISNARVLKDNTYLSFDFTNAMEKALGLEQLKTTGDGVYFMFAGDFTKDGVIQSTDFDAWSSDNAVTNEYHLFDVNLDGTVQVTDSDFWQPNKAKIGVAEVWLD